MVLPIPKSNIISSTAKKNRYTLFKQIESFDIMGIYNELINNDNKNVLDETELQAAVKKTKLPIELENEIWKWKTSHHFKGFTIKKKHEIEENIYREKQKNKQDLQNIKSKEALAAVKEKENFKVKARVEKNHTLLEMWFKK